MKPMPKYCMNFLNRNKFILFLTVVLICAGLSGCAKPKIDTERPQTMLDTVGKLEAIGLVLGCMFDPTPCQEKAKEQETE